MTCTPHSNKAFLLHRMRSFHVRISTETTVSSVLTNQAENIIREHNPGRCFSSPSFPQSPRNLLQPLNAHTVLWSLSRTGESGLQIFFKLHDFVWTDVNVRQNWSLSGVYTVYIIMCDEEMTAGFLNASAENVYDEKSAFSQTEHNIVAAYLITAGKEQRLCFCIWC